MEPLVSIIMGSTSDYEIMEKAAKFLDDNGIPFEINALSAHRTAEKVMEFARNAEKRGVKVIIAGAGMAAALPGAVAAETSLPVIGVPIKTGFEGLDSVLSMLQMPPGIPVATVAVNGSMNAAVLATEILSLCDKNIREKMHAYKASLKDKIIKANQDLAQKKFKNRVF